MNPLRPLLLLTALVAACGEPGHRVRVIDVVDDDGRLALKDVDLQTLDDLTTVRGSVAQMWGSATIDLAPETLTRDQGASRSTVATGPRAVHARWITDGDVVVPSDYDSLVMLTAYYHFERAALFFSDIGVSVEADAVPVYYEPKLIDASAAGMIETDNAAYFPDADGFLLLPMSILQEIPFGTNPGVVAHEYSHRIWYYTLWRGEMFATLEDRIADGWDIFENSSWTRLRSTDEGIADFFAAAISGDPDYLAHSTPPNLSDGRSLGVLRVLDAAWLNGDEPIDTRGNFDVYAAGSVVASTLWSLAQTLDVPTVAGAIIEAQHALSPELRSNFAYLYGDLEAEIIAQLPAASRPTACARFRQSYDAAWVRFTAVCP